MPFGDNRRIFRPANTYSVSNYQKTRRKYWPIISNDGYRHDGRKENELRSIYLKTGIIQMSDGSAYLETDGTKLVCAVYGPRDHQKKHDFSSTGELTCSISFSPFSQKERVADKNDLKGKEISGTIVEALRGAICMEAYPKSFIDIFINILEDDGNLLSNCVIAASLALAHAGIEMFDLVTSVSMVFNNNIQCIDPSAKERLHPSIMGNLSIAYLPSLNEISCFIKDGEQNVEDMSKCVSKCIESCLRVHILMKECLLEAFREKTKNETTS